MPAQPYPSFWPKANPKKPDLLQSRITEADKLALYNREITTRALAKKLNVHERYLSSVFPHKVPIADKRELCQARKAYRMTIAQEVIDGKHQVKDAAKICNVSTSSMSRYVRKLNASKAVKSQPLVEQGA